MSLANSSCTLVVPPLAFSLCKKVFSPTYQQEEVFDLNYGLLFYFYFPIEKHKVDIFF